MGGACPQTALEARASGAKKYLPKHKRTPLNRIHPTGLLSKSTQTVQDEIFSLESYNFQTSKEQTERSFDLVLVYARSYLLL